MINRDLLDNIVSSCFSGKIILLLGARQVGKTTLLREVLKKIGVASNWLNADESDVLQAFTNATTSTQLLHLVGMNHKIVVIDEAQQIPEIKKKLKFIYDTHPEIQLIATDSSSFELQNRMAEPLTGLKKTFYLFPISYRETVKNSSPIEIANNYLYKDILQLDNIRKS